MQSFWGIDWVEVTSVVLSSVVKLVLSLVKNHVDNLKGGVESSLVIVVWGKKLLHSLIIVKFLGLLESELFYLLDYSSDVCYQKGQSYLILSINWG